MLTSERIAKWNIKRNLAPKKFTAQVLAAELTHPATKNEEFHI